MDIFEAATPKRLSITAEGGSHFEFQNYSLNLTDSIGLFPALVNQENAIIQPSKLNATYLDENKVSVAISSGPTVLPNQLRLVREASEPVKINRDVTVSYDPELKVYKFTVHKSGVVTDYEIPEYFSMKKLFENAVSEKGRLDPNLLYHVHDKYGPWDESLLKVDWLGLSKTGMHSRQATEQDHIK